MPFNRMLSPQHSYGAGSYPGAAALARLSRQEKQLKVEIPGAHPLQIGAAFPGPTALLRGTHIETAQKVEIPGAHILNLGGMFPGPESLIEATRVKKLITVEVPGARPLDIGGAYPGPEDLNAATDPVRPHAIEVPGVQMGFTQADSYLDLKAYIVNLHISLAPAPPGRETAPPSPRQAAIDAYTGR